MKRRERVIQWPSDLIGFGRWIFLVTCSLSHWTTPLYASQDQLKEGNRQFKNGHYEKALKLYEDALVDTPHSAMLKYNAGSAAYQTGDWAKASRYFQEAETTAPNALKAAARYNRGNALYRETRTADAIEAYKDALRVNPFDEDAKYNLSVAMRAQQNASSSGAQGQPKSQKDKQGQGQGQEKKDQGSQGQGQTNEQKPGQMSREDAQRLLEAAGAGEMHKGNQQTTKPEKANVDEDW